MAEHDIVLQLVAPPSVDDDALEANMMDVLSAVEQHAVDIALGPVVAVDLDRHLIDVGFNVEATTFAEAQHKVGEVLRVIGDHTRVQLTATNAQAVSSTGHTDNLCVA